MKKWLCIICGFIYDEAEGWPDDGIPPGTRWEDVPEDWVCPECGVGKADFEMIELDEDDDVAAAQPQPAVSPAPVPAPRPDEPIVIVGSGHAGYSVAEQIRQRDSRKPIVVFTRDDGRHYSKPTLSNALSRGKSAAELATHSALDMERRLGIRVHPFCDVLAIDREQRLVHTSIGEQPYDRLVLAVGAEPIRPPLQGDGAADVLSINDLDDYHRFRGRLAPEARVAIIGNGLIGCEFANDLSANGHTVAVIGKGRWPMDRQLPEAAGRRLQSALAELGVEWHLENTVSQVTRASSGYGLTLGCGTRLEADIVLSAVGLTPRTDLAANADVDVGRGIRVDAHLRTTDPAIHAIGDCVEIDGRLLPFIAPINHAARVVADNALGTTAAVDFPPMPVAVKTPAHPVSVLPPAPEQTGEWTVEEQEDGLRALFRETGGELAGFVLTGARIRERQQLVSECTGARPPRPGANVA
ncbi:MAG: FAD-dependent oxidoreductase [Ectothiorhodospiraceae bacterium]|jgi:rubredoxin-NAD+ reductase